METDKVKELVPADSVLLVYDDRSGEEVLAPVRQETGNLKWFFGDVVDQFLLAIGSPRQVPDQQLVEDDSRRPDVALGGVGGLFEDLGGHVERGSHYSFQQRRAILFDVTGQSEIC